MAPPAAAARGTGADDGGAPLRTRVEERLRPFEAGPPTPAAAFALEQELRVAFDAAGRALLGAAFHRGEPVARDQAAAKVRYHRQTYRLNKRTPVKRSGMRWGQETGPVILDLGVAYWSGLWEAAFSRDLAARAVPEPRGVPRANGPRGSQEARRTATRCFAA
jgi:hypothetical protein